MKIVIFGLSVSSAWGNGHATLLRGLFRALHNKGHQVVFFELDTPYYAVHRDAAQLPYADLRLYSDWQSVHQQAREELEDAEVGMVTSFCPDGIACADLVRESRVPRKVFYDLDTPVTLERVARGEPIEYVPRNGYAGFDLVLSYTGGPSLSQLRNQLGAARVEPLYGWVDPAIHSPTDTSNDYAARLAYLGTYAKDRQPGLEALMIQPARQMPRLPFLVAGAMYPDHLEWPANVRLLPHVAPPDHSRFYSSSPLMLNITRAAMVRDGYCPSGRLFESAACGTAVLSDWWHGLDAFFEPEREILIAHTSEQAVDALKRDAADLKLVGERARERALACHTAEHRAQRFLDLVA